MICPIEFQKLIDMSESSTLDFKAKMYDFNDDKDLVKTSKFVKDIISFSNTIRNENSYIIIGIEETIDGTKIFHGIDENVDDSILQDKVKDKVFPRPQFIYYTLNYNSKKYGIIEFPVFKYSTPLAPSIKMKGLEVGSIYYRHGSTNSEAKGLEVIRINDWFRSLPENNIESNINDEITQIIKRLTSNNEKLSSIIADTLIISRKYNIIKLIEFCKSEINGINEKKINESPDNYKYRIHKVIISLSKIEVNLSLFKVTASMVRKEMENNNEDFFDYRMLFNTPVLEIEEYIQRIQDNPDTLFATKQISSLKIFPDAKDDYPVYIYLFEDTFISIYRSIRQKLIDKLIEI